MIKIVGYIKLAMMVTPWPKIITKTYERKRRDNCITYYYHQYPINPGHYNNNNWFLFDHVG